MMRIPKTVFGVLAFTLAIVATPTSATSWPTAPNGSVVAVATISGSYANVTTRGKAVFVAPPSGDAYVAVNLTGGLNLITMAHIHMYNASAGNPVVLGLLPKLPTKSLALLDPPVSFKGVFWWITKFSTDSLPSGVSEDAFFDCLRSGLLYVNVHTVAFPGGAVRGNLTCKHPCMYT